MTDRKPASSPSLVTGATGLLGSHIAEQLVRRGTAVRALCRANADTRFLESIGAEIVRGELGDREALRRACDGVGVVYHAAARVGDWGPWPEFVAITIEGTRTLLDAAASARVARFLHISSISAYGHVNGEGLVLDETAPLGRCLNRWSYYSRAKVEAEKLVWEAHRSGRMPVTVIRPSWLYGPRDRATLPRLIHSIRAGKAKLVGDGENRLNVAHAGNVAEGAILAATSERGVGEAYNVCHDVASSAGGARPAWLTQKDYFNRVATAIGAPPVTKRVPYRVAKSAAFAMELFGHVFRSKKPPLVTRYSVWLMGRRCFFECQKIKDQLGWRPTVSYDEGIPAAVEEYLSRGTCTPGRAAIAPIPETHAAA